MRISGALKARVVGLMVILGLMGVAASAQDRSFTPGGMLGFRTAFNLDDISMGGEGGITIPDYRTSLIVGFDGRLGSRRVLVQDAADLFYILRERRYMLTLQAEQRFKVAELGSSAALEPFVRLGGAYTFANYRAFGLIKPYKGFIFLPAAGFAFNIDETFIARIGYQYQKSGVESIEPHRILLGGTFQF